MKYSCLIMAFSLALTACGESRDVNSVESEGETATIDVNGAEVADGAAIDQPSAIPASMDAQGKVLIMVDRLVPETAACLMMISVANGTDTAVDAGLFAFNVTGNGKEAGANMFPQTVDPGSVKTAQIVLQSAGCDNAKRIEGGQLNCLNSETGDSCLDAVELRDGLVDFAAND